MTASLAKRRSLQGEFACFKPKKNGLPGRPSGRTMLRHSFRGRSRDSRKLFSRIAAIRARSCCRMLRSRVSYAASHTRACLKVCSARVGASRSSRSPSWIYFGLRFEIASSGSISFEGDRAQKTTKRRRVREKRPEHRVADIVWSKGNVLLFQRVTEARARRDDPLRGRERLGWLLRSYYQNVA
jgi:hypothetical protein